MSAAIDITHLQHAVVNSTRTGDVLSVSGRGILNYTTGCTSWYSGLASPMKVAVEQD